MLRRSLPRRKAFRKDDGQNRRLASWTDDVEPGYEGIEKLLNDGSEYDIQKHKDDLFSGKTPFEASNMYSRTLKDTIIRCMDYRQHKRASFADLKLVTKEWAGKELPPGSKANGDLIICISEAMEEFGLGQTYGRSKKRRT